MRIPSLRLVNFRSYPETTFAFEPLTIVRGPNHSGKSTLVQALELTLAGRSDATDERGAGAAKLIRTGQTQGAATVELVGNDGTTRFVDCGLSLDAGRVLKITNPADPTSPGKDFEYYLKTQSEIFSCLIDTHRFVSKPQAEQKLIIASIVLPERHAFPQDRRDQCAEVGLQINWDLPPLEVIGDDKRGAYKAAYEARTGVNRQIKAFKLPEGDVSKAGDEQEIREKLATRKGELEEAMKLRGAEETAAQVYITNKNNAADRLTKAEARLSSEQQEAESTKKAVLSKAAIEALEATAKNATEAKRLLALVGEKNAELGIKKRDLDALDALSRKVGSACPTCAQDITAEMVGRMIEPITAAINTLSEEIRAAQDTLKAIGDYEGAQKQLDANASAAEEAGRIERRIAQAHEDVKSARTETEKFVSPPARTEGLDANIASLRERVGKGENALAERVRANSVKTSIEAAQEQKKKLDKHSQILEGLVEYFGTGPTSAMTKLLSEHIEPFEASMNERLAPWGYQCRLNFEPFVFGVTRGENTYALNLLSESERYQFAIAFQAALAFQSGHKFVVVDATEIFDVAGRRAMMRSLLSSGLDQIIVLATDERTDPIPASAGPSALYMLRCENEGNVPTTYVEPLGL